MHYLVYEYLLGGGLQAEQHPAAPSLLREGRAMLNAVVADLVALPDTRVSVLLDARAETDLPAGCQILRVTRPGEDFALLAEWASQVKATLLIAPEFNRALLDRCRAVVLSGGDLLGPDMRIIQLCSSKSATIERLVKAGVPVQPGVRLSPGDLFPTDFPLPAIVKPEDGAGTLETLLLSNLAQAEAAVAGLKIPMRLEQFHPGLAVSCACLCGPAGIFPLPPCTQRMEVDADGRLHYGGGSTPLEPALAARAQSLAQQAVGALIQPQGYLGVDLMLGAAADGSQDAVLEINPRLTTSYVALRAICKTNLAGQMLQILAGGRPDWSFATERLEFTPAGALQWQTGPQ